MPPRIYGTFNYGRLLQAHTRGPVDPRARSNDKSQTRMLHVVVHRADGAAFVKLAGRAAPSFAPETFSTFFTGVVSFHASMLICGRAEGRNSSRQEITLGRAKAGRRVIAEQSRDHFITVHYFSSVFSRLNEAASRERRRAPLAIQLNPNRLQRAQSLHSQQRQFPSKLCNRESKDIIVAQRSCNLFDALQSEA